MRKPWSDYFMRSVGVLMACESADIEGSDINRAFTLGNQRTDRSRGNRREQNAIAVMARGIDQTRDTRVFAEDRQIILRMRAQPRPGFNNRLLGDSRHNF